MLRSSFNEFTTKARELETANSPDNALVSWLRDCVAFTGNYQGVVDAMMVGKEDPKSSLHASCVTIAHGSTRLIARA